MRGGIRPLAWAKEIRRDLRDLSGFSLIGYESCAGRDGKAAGRMEMRHAFGRSLGSLLKPVGLQAGHRAGGWKSTAVPRKQAGGRFRRFLQYLTALFSATVLLYRALCFSISQTECHCSWPSSAGTHLEYPPGSLSQKACTRNGVFRFDQRS